MTWQPIETAPKDGSIVVLADATKHPDDFAASACVGLWTERWGGLRANDEMIWADWGVGFDDDGPWKEVHNPTHWMPLPEAPK